MRVLYALVYLVCLFCLPNISKGGPCSIGLTESWAPHQISTYVSDTIRTFYPLAIKLELKIGIEAEFYARDRYRVLQSLAKDLGNKKIQIRSEYSSWRDFPLFEKIPHASYLGIPSPIGLLTADNGSDYAELQTPAVLPKDLHFLLLILTLMGRDGALGTTLALEATGAEVSLQASVDIANSRVMNRLILEWDEHQFEIESEFQPTPGRGKFTGPSPRTIEALKENPNMTYSEMGAHFLNRWVPVNPRPATDKQVREISDCAEFRRFDIDYEDPDKMERQLKLALAMAAKAHFLAEQRTGENSPTDSIPH